MKLIFCGADNLYDRFYQYFSYTNEAGEVMGSYFDKNEYDFFHLINRDYINFVINNLDGIKNVSYVIIQKSWYKNFQLRLILNRFRLFNPNVKVIICMDVNLKQHEVFISEVVKNDLAWVAVSEKDVDDLFQNNFKINQENLTLSKIKKKHIKKMWKN